MKKILFTLHTYMSCIRLLTRSSSSILSPVLHRTAFYLQKASFRHAATMSGPPKHEMIYLKGTASTPATMYFIYSWHVGLTKNIRAEGQFRKVLHTGLYSQLVSMEVPVGGDIGDEVQLVIRTSSFRENLISTEGSYGRSSSHLHFWKRSRHGCRKEAGGCRT